jgi:hypothetical protein
VDISFFDHEPPIRARVHAILSLSCSMEITLVVSVVAAATSVIVAVVSGLMSRRTARSVEELKVEVGTRQAARERLDDESRVAIGHLQKLIASVQNVKDAALLVHDVAIETTDLTSIKRTIEDAVRAMVNSFSDAAAHLSDEELRAAHTAKEVAWRLQFSANLKSIDRLDAMRTELSALQTQLRQLRLQRLTENLSANLQ